MSMLPGPEFRVCMEQHGLYGGAAWLIRWSSMAYMVEQHGFCGDVNQYLCQTRSWVVGVELGCDNISFYQESTQCLPNFKRPRVSSQHLGWVHVSFTNFSAHHFEAGWDETESEKLDLSKFTTRLRPRKSGY